MGTQWRGWQTNFPRNARQSVVLISCSKSCGIQAQGGQAVADRAMPTLKKMLSLFFRSSCCLPLTLFCRLSGEVTENTFLYVKKTKSVAYCGNFWGRSLAHFMRAAQFASVSSCARHLLKHFRRESIQIIWDTDDWWILVSRDISRTILWFCGLSSYSGLNHWLSQRFLQCWHKLMVKVNKQNNSDTENVIYNQHRQRLAI